jgi:hypothetical protein
MTSRRTLIKNLKTILYNTVKVVEEKKLEKRGRNDKYKISYYIKYILQVLLD